MSAPADMPAGPRDGGHDEWEALAVGWALSTLERQDEDRFAVHLPGCEQCAGTVRESLHTVADLAYALPDAEPPAALKMGIMEAVRAEPRLRPDAGAPPPGVEDPQPDAEDPPDQGEWPLGAPDTDWFARPESRTSPAPPGAAPDAPPPTPGSELPRSEPPPVADAGPPAADAGPPVADAGPPADVPWTGRLRGPEAVGVRPDALAGDLDKPIGLWAGGDPGADLRAGREPETDLRAGGDPGARLWAGGEPGTADGAGAAGRGRHAAPDDGYRSTPDTVVPFERPARRWAPWAAVGAVVALLAALGGWNLKLRADQDDLRQVVAQRTAEVAQRDALVAQRDAAIRQLTANGPARVAALTANGQPSAARRATIVVRGNQIEIIIEELGASPENTTYWLWTLRCDTTRPTDLRPIRGFTVPQAQFSVRSIGSDPGFAQASCFAISEELGTATPTAPREVVAVGQPE
jgi:hypothetical protein